MHTFSMSDSRKPSTPGTWAPSDGAQGFRPKGTGWGSEGRTEQAGRGRKASYRHPLPVPRAEHVTLPRFLGGDAGSRRGRWRGPGSGPRGCHSTEQFRGGTEKCRPRPPARGIPQSAGGAAMTNPAGWTVQPTLYRTFGSSSSLSHCRNDLLTIFTFLCL